MNEKSDMSMIRELVPRSIRSLRVIQGLYTLNTILTEVIVWQGRLVLIFQKQKEDVNKHRSWGEETEVQL
jgi:hypothetical protein